jgi:membrane-associated phospholipid phosphatase
MATRGQPGRRSGGAEKAAARSLRRHGGARLEPTDWLCLGYHLGFFLLLAAAGPAGRLAAWRGWAVAHLATLAAIVWLATRPSLPPGLALLRRWYPVLSLLWLYGEVGALRHLVVPADLDPLVAGWDAAIFRGEPHLALPRALPAWALEALHGVYASYYLLLFVPGLLATRRAAESVRRYVAVLNAAMLAHYLAGILVPVSGPVARRPEVIPPGELFIPMMDALYALFDRGGMAFPSTHVAASVIAAAFAGRWFPRARLWLWALAAAVAFSTVACCYHYAIDTVAGAATGALALALAGKDAVAGRKHRRRATPA